MTNRTRTAFTLLELLLVVVIIGILAATIIPSLGGRSEQARISAAKQDLSTLHLALTNFNNDTGKYPTTDQGLEALITRPTSIREDMWHGRYVQADSVPLDPWGNKYVYSLKTETEYELKSSGPDGRAGTQDDVTSTRK